MSLDRSTIAMAIMALIIAALTFAVVFFARDEFEFGVEHDAEVIPTPSAVSSKEGYAVITLSKPSQVASGIGVSELTVANKQGSMQVYGTVINPQPLFEARAQYLAALAEVRTQRIGLVSTESEYQRLKRLNADDRNVSDHVVLEAQARWRGDQARLAAAEQSVNAIKSSLRAAWGETVAAWAADPEGAVFRELSAQRQVLAQIIVPYEVREQVAKRPLRIGPVGATDELRAARYVGPSQAAEAGSAGVTYLYLADAKDLRQGMRVRGSMTLEGDARQGVLIPPAAVVWHGGKAWCYIQKSSEEFVRREVDTREELDGGWFNASGFEPGHKVVTRGAQLLLSEEQKFQIREENED